MNQRSEGRNELRPNNSVGLKQVAPPKNVSSEDDADVAEHPISTEGGSTSSGFWRKQNSVLRESGKPFAF